MNLTGRKEINERADRGAEIKRLKRDIKSRRCGYGFQPCSNVAQPTMNIAPPRQAADAAQISRTDLGNSS
jgi:hypothetical protein